MALFSSTCPLLLMVLVWICACSNSGGKGHTAPPTTPIVPVIPIALENCTSEDLPGNSCLEAAALSLKGMTDEADRVEAMVSNTIKCKPTREEFRSFLCRYSQEGN